MAKITIKNLTKKYGNINALSNISFDVEDKEFLVLFGPAGAGKTTLLSAISGILDCDEGTIAFNDEKIDDLEPGKRNVAMVFENYALYPHFNVYDNIAFPLRSPEYQTDEKTIDKLVRSVTQKMNIGHLLDRLPSQVSNGQRQRIALGRALVRNPNVFLMDEPLAHLDAKLKNFMRTELKSIAQQLDTTTIYVTHDYLEALSLADKIVVINEGKLIQIGTPDDIYYYPSNTFVAKLVGEPEINLYKCSIEKKTLVFPDSNFSLNIDNETIALLEKDKKITSVIVGVRGADITVSVDRKDGFKEGRIVDFHSIGNRFVIEIECNGIFLSALIPSDSKIEINQCMFFKINSKRLLFFDCETESLILKRV